MTTWASTRSRAEIGRRVALAVPCGACQMVAFFWRGERPSGKSTKHLVWGRYIIAAGPWRGHRATSVTGRLCPACGSDLTNERLLRITFDPRRWQEIRLDSVPKRPTASGGPPPPKYRPNGGGGNGGGGGGGDDRPPSPRVPPPQGPGALPDPQEYDEIAALPPPRATVYEILPGQHAPPMPVTVNPPRLRNQEDQRRA